MAAIKPDDEERFGCQYMLTKRYLHCRKDLDDQQHQKNLIDHLDGEIFCKTGESKTFDQSPSRREQKKNALTASNTPRPTYVTSSTRVKTLDIFSRRSGGAVFRNQGRPFADSCCCFV